MTHNSRTRLAGSETAASIALERSRIPLPGSLLAILAVGLILPLMTDSAALASAAQGWTDKTLVASFDDLEAKGELLEAVLAPALPGHPPRKTFLDALAWFAAGTPDGAGSLTLDELDGFLESRARFYIRLLKEHVVEGEMNDYARTRNWKVIQKLTLLRGEMTRGDGTHAFPVIERVPGGDDPWEREHTLGSEDEFRVKVCDGSHERPVLVKFGNTNCTQCMLFEIIGSVKEIAENPAHKDAVDVYKVWWGLRPDESFDGKIRQPELLDELVAKEGVQSSPWFIVYRNGRRYPCGDAFPDTAGSDARLEACLQQEFVETPLTGVCADGTEQALSRATGL